MPADPESGAAAPDPVDAGRDSADARAARRRELERGLDPARDDDPEFEAKVRRSFLEGRRLVRMPARARKKGVILRFLLDELLPDDQPIEERELNARLATWNPDVAALRRYLVDAGLVDRDGMTYRRSAARPPKPRRAGGAPRDDSPRPDV
jgi:hypothetical protein